MEPFHKLAVCSAIDLEAQCAKLDITTRWSTERFLVDKPDGYRTLVCERKGDRAVFSVGPCPRDGDTQLLIYVNRLDDALTGDIRRQLESVGAAWSYYHR